MKRQIMSVVLAFGIVCLLFSASYAQPNNAPANKSGADSYSFQTKDFSKSYPGKPSAPSSEIIKCIYDKCPQTDKNAPSNPNITKPNPQLKDVIQGKQPVSQQPQQSQAQQQVNNQPQQLQKSDEQKLKEWSQQKINSMSVTKTKTIPDPNNAIFVSKPRTDEQPARKDKNETKYQLTLQDMGEKPAVQQTQNQNKQNAQVQNQTQNQQQNCVRDPKFPQLISCDPKGLKK
ncbi:hypothetical protein [Thermodesulfovibrio sp.]|uniref:hypothetical protein n=1 Tax=Thermodesulfovibrio sp. TaxID=2067987 RepID=UPI0030A422A3